jgi:hypothetical protein
MYSDPMGAAVPYTDDQLEAFLRSITPPEEERRRYTSAPWSGGFRWFRSANVIPIEQRRRRRQDDEPDSAT